LLRQITHVEPAILHDSPGYFYVNSLNYQCAKTASGDFQSIVGSLERGQLISAGGIGDREAIYSRAGAGRSNLCRYNDGAILISYLAFNRSRRLSRDWNTE